MGAGRCARLSALLLAFSITCVVGCGERPVSVVGTVKFADGGPVAGGQVEFQAVDRKLSAIGFIGPDGRFTLGTSGRDDGAFVGKYRVAIKPPPIPEMDPGQPEKSQAASAARVAWLEAVPPRYQSADGSGLEVAIDANTKSVDLVIERDAMAP